MNKNILVYFVIIILLIVLGFVFYPRTGVLKLTYDLYVDKEYETTTITFGLEADGEYTIDWGDGTVETLTTNEPSHKFTKIGLTQITIKGDIKRFYNNESFSMNSVEEYCEYYTTYREDRYDSEEDCLDKIGAIEKDIGVPFSELSVYEGGFREGSNYSHLRLVSVDEWSNIKWSSMEGMFKGTVKLQKIPDEAPNLSNVKNMSLMFYISGLSQDMGHWDTSKVKDMSFMFRSQSLRPFNISGWNVSRVENCANFNTSLSRRALPSDSAWPNFKEPCYIYDKYINYTRIKAPNTYVEKNFR